MFLKFFLVLVYQYSFHFFGHNNDRTAGYIYIDDQDRALSSTSDTRSDPSAAFDRGSSSKKQRLYDVC